MKRNITVIAAIAACCLAFALSASAEAGTVYVLADELNGRSAPSKKASIEACFTQGDELEAVDYKNGWVEVIGGETGTVWCKAEYLTECEIKAEYKNTSGGRVFVRKELGGKDTSTKRVIGNGKRVTITRVLFGFGYTGSGWVDMSFLQPAQDE